LNVLLRPIVGLSFSRPSGANLPEAAIGHHRPRNEFDVRFPRPGTPTNFFRTLKILESEGHAEMVRTHKKNVLETAGGAHDPQPASVFIPMSFHALKKARNLLISQRLAAKSVGRSARHRAFPATVPIWDVQFVEIRGQPFEFPHTFLCTTPPDPKGNPRGPTSTVTPIPGPSRWLDRDFFFRNQLQPNSLLQFHLWGAPAFSS